MKMKIVRTVVLLSGCFCLSLGIVNAQSTDIAAPVPVRTNEVNAAISARDLGDSRLTDHYYAFTGTPGDLLITVDARNMNGDVDVFTAVGLRPLLKFTIYAGGSAPITKSIYLRQRQDLILRVEARTPNDDDAVYRIHFGGAFEAIAGGPLLAENENNSDQPAAPATRAAVKKGRRVSSVGARIEEPPEPEVAAAPSPEPTPAESVAATTPEPSKSARNTGIRRPAPGRRTPGSTKQEAPAETASSETEPTTSAPGETAPKSATESKPVPRRRGSRRGTTSRTTTPAPEPEPNTGPRLVIETSDGTLIDRYMNTVRRVTVENGVVIVTGKDGKIDRVLLANVVRMSIAP
jgi:hypothetical protein